MATALATRNGADGSIEGFDRAKVELIKRTVARDTNDDQLELFLYTARTRGLDPLLKQVHAVVRKGEMAIQVGIDGLRLIAARTQVYMGNDEPVFVEGDGKYPLKATVTVYRQVAGQRCAFTDSAYWAEFYPDDASGFMWRKMPHVMLGKVAESRALRKAFPHETSGLYSDDEMHQADRTPAQPAPVIRMVDPATAEVAIPITFDREAPAPEAMSQAEQVKAELKARVEELQLFAAASGVELPDVTRCKTVREVKQWIADAEKAIPEPF